MDINKKKCLNTMLNSALIKTSEVDNVRNKIITFDEIEKSKNDSALAIANTKDNLIASSMEIAI